MAKKSFKRIPKLKPLGTYKGKYKVQNKNKYIGDASNVIYRSNWEKQAFKYCESASWIKAWGSEVTIIPYICKTDNRPHRYYMDLTIVTENDDVLLVEIKPAKQTKRPIIKKRTKQTLNEALTYTKNESKWLATKEICKRKGWRFEIWTEHHLKSLGCKI